MKRHFQWAQRLHLLVESSKAVTFAWGTYDCGQFAARAIREMTGVDVAAPYRGKYGDEASAEALFLNGHADLGSFAAAIAAANGMPEITPVTYAQRGDLLWVDNGTPAHPSKYGALGIVSLDGRYAVCMSETGTKRVHMHRWRRAWKVG
jgi:hypothetical protein